jgi:hypothetical protein
MPDVSKADQLIEAAIARLARGDGRGALLNLGIDRTQVIRDAEVGTGVLYNHFGDHGQSNSIRGLVDEVMRRLLLEQRRLAADVATLYHSQAEALTDGAGRPPIAKAIRAEEMIYGMGREADALARARQRAYYLAVALADADTSDLQLPISQDDHVRPDVRFRQYAIESRSGQQAATLDIYRSLLAATGREPVTSLKQLVLVIRALFEGAMLLKRVAAGRGRRTAQTDDDLAALDGDLLVDAILRVFIAMSEPATSPPSDPDSVLFGRERDPVPRATCDAVCYRDRAAMLEAVLGEIDALSGDDTLSLCALHRSEISRLRADDGQLMRPVVVRFVSRGGDLRTLEKIS